jgi:hypothetical protein
VHRRGLLIGLALLLAGCSSTGPYPAALPAALPAAVAIDAQRPLQATWLRTELYFATGLLGVDEAAQEARWRDFLDRSVTPRFPDGLTVLDAYGQWQDPGARAPERLRSKLLIVLHDPQPDTLARIEAVRSDWKALSGDDSVLRVTQPAEISF